MGLRCCGFLGHAAYYAEAGERVATGGRAAGDTPERKTMKYSSKFYGFYVSHRLRRVL